MLVRPYTVADLDALIVLFQDSLRTVARRDYTLEQVLAWAADEVDREGWALRLATCSTWVAGLGACAVGFISLEPSGRVDMLYVDAQHQGRSIASSLLRRAESSARARGLLRLFTEASITAKPFFERRGFHAGEAQTVARRGQELTNFRMTRRLV